jgi:alpha-L-fucosidase 2
MKKITLLILTSLIIASCSEKIIRVACVGDSITEGAGLKKQSETSYPVMLDSILGSKYDVLNCGRSATTLQKKGDFPYWISKEFSNIFVYKPNIIVIKLGTNDTKPQNWNAERFEQDYQSLIDTLKTISTTPKILLCLPVPVYKTEWGINDSTLTGNTIPVIKKIAEKNKLSVIDLYAGLSNQKDNFPDNIHPNERGAKNMAAIIAKNITTNN